MFKGDRGKVCVASGKAGISAAIRVTTVLQRSRNLGLMTLASYPSVQQPP